MSLFEQTIPQLEAQLADAEHDLETVGKGWSEEVRDTESYWNDAEPLSHVLTAAIGLANYRRKALKRAKKAAGKVSDEFATMSAGFDDEPSEQRIVAIMEEFIATARRSGFIIEGIRYDPSQVGEIDA